MTTQQSPAAQMGNLEILILLSLPVSKVIGDPVLIDGGSNHKLPGERRRVAVETRPPDFSNENKKSDCVLSKG
jgi:hypothetical protein